MKMIHEKNRKRKVLSQLSQQADKERKQTWMSTEEDWQDNMVTLVKKGHTQL